MANRDLVEGVLEFAVKKEQEAIDLYSHLALDAVDPASREAYERLATEEARHRDLLADLKERRALTLTGEAEEILNPAAWVGDLEPATELSGSDALLFAMKREQEAVEMYRNLARVTADEALKEILLGLSGEEARHRDHLEQEYRAAAL